MKHTKLIVVAGIIAVAVAGAGLFVWQSQEESAPVSQPITTSGSSAQTGITLAQVEQNNGKNGAKCWVIVDTIVYEISGFAQWVDGVHTSSGGVARCGKDLTSVVGDSPHGRSVLKLLTNVGQYQP